HEVQAVSYESLKWTYRFREFSEPCSSWLKGPVGKRPSTDHEGNYTHTHTTSDTCLHTIVEAFIQTPLASRKKLFQTHAVYSFRFCPFPNPEQHTLNLFPIELRSARGYV